MIDFAPAMTLSSAPVTPMCKTIGKLIARITFLTFFVLQFHFSTFAQCSYELDNAHFNGQPIELSSITKTGSSAYWFAFTADSKAFTLDIDFSGDVVFHIGEAVASSCERASVRKLEHVSHKIRSGNRFSTKTLERGKRYYVVIGSPEIGNNTVAFHNFIKPSNDIVKPHKGKTLPDPAMVQEPAPTFTGDAKVARASNAPRKQYEITREQLEADIKWLQEKIAAYELRPDQNAGELNKMKTALANWIKRLENID